MWHDNTHCHVQNLKTDSQNESESSKHGNFDKNKTIHHSVLAAFFGLLRIDENRIDKDVFTRYRKSILHRKHEI